MSISPSCTLICTEQHEQLKESEKKNEYVIRRQQERPDIPAARHYKKERTTRKCKINK